MIFDIVIPSFKRKEKLIRCLNSIFKAKKNLKKDQIQIYIYFDNNDKITYNYFTNKYNNIKCNLMNKQYRAFGIWNKHLQILDSCGMVYLCDDTQLYPETLYILFELFNQIYKNTDGILTFNQYNLESASKYAMGLIGKKFINRFPNNQCFCPDYVSFYADAELGRFAESLNKFYFGNGIKIHHFHPAFYPNEKDSTHLLVRDEQQKIDKEVNKKRRERGLLWGKDFKLIRPTIEGNIK